MLRSPHFPSSFFGGQFIDDIVRAVEGDGGWDEAEVADEEAVEWMSTPDPTAAGSNAWIRAQFETYLTSLLGQSRGCCWKALGVGSWVTSMGLC